MDCPEFLTRIALERNCSPELVRAIMTDCLGALHEATVKGGRDVGARTAYSELGPLAAWHYVGLLVAAAEDGGPGQLLDQIDPTLKSFASIRERWRVEIQDQIDEHSRRGAVAMTGKPFSLQYQQTMPGPLDVEIVCQKQADDAWSVWTVVSSQDDDADGYDLTRGIRTAAEFCAAFLRCGVMYGMDTDVENIAENIEFFEREDPALAAQLRKHLEMDLYPDSESPE